MGQSPSSTVNGAKGAVLGGCAGVCLVAATGGLAAGPISAALWGGWLLEAALCGVSVLAAVGGGLGYASHAPNHQANTDIDKMQREMDEMRAQQADLRRERAEGERETEQARRLRMEAVCKYEELLEKHKRDLDELLLRKRNIETEWPLPAGLDEAIINIAIVGNSGVGKSSLVNKVLGEKKADIGVNETTMAMQAFDADLCGLPFKLWDVPGAGTHNFPQQDYIKKMGLRYFDVLLILTGDRWSESDIKLFEAARRFRVPCYIVRSKMDRAIEDNEEDKGVAAEDTLTEIREHLKKSISSDNWDRVFLITVRDHKYPQLLKPEYQGLLRMVGSDLVKTRDIKCPHQTSPSTEDSSTPQPQQQHSSHKSASPASCTGDSAGASLGSSSDGKWEVVVGCPTRTRQPQQQQYSHKSVSPASSAGDSAGASSGPYSYGSWDMLAGCFTRSTLLKQPNGTFKMVSSLKVDDKVLSAHGASDSDAITVTYAEQLPRFPRDMVHLHTAVSDLVVTSDHRVAIAGGTVKFAHDIAVGDVVICGKRQQGVTRVAPFKMNAEVVELRFDVDLPVETFKGPPHGIVTYGVPMPQEADDLQTDDGF